MDLELGRLHELDRIASIPDQAEPLFRSRGIAHTRRERGERDDLAESRGSTTAGDADRIALLEVLIDDLECRALHFVRAIVATVRGRKHQASLRVDPATHRR